MSTAESKLDLEEKADSDTVMRHAFEGEPLDPEIARRVEERARRVTEEIYRIHGIISEETLNQILREVREK
jgi:hypothetical protein